jgi:hypothetical protein
MNIIKRIIVAIFTSLRIAILHIIKRIIVAISTSLIIAILPKYNHSSFRLDFDFTGFVFITVFFMIYLVPISILVDLLYNKFFATKLNSYLFKLFSYTLIGLLYEFIVDVADKGYVTFYFILFFHTLLIFRKPLGIR